MKKISNALFLFVAMLCAFGCSTPKDVLSLAKQGAAITVQTQSKLTDFVDQKNEVYRKRLEAIKRISNGNIEASAEIAVEEYAADLAGMKEQLKMQKTIYDISDKRLSTQALMSKQQSDLEKKLQVGSSVTVPKDKYVALATAFSQLAEEFSYKEWATFAIQYGKDVKSTMDTLKDQADKAKNTADTLVASSPKQ